MALLLDRFMNVSPWKLWLFILAVDFAVVMQIQNYHTSGWLCGPRSEWFTFWVIPYFVMLLLTGAAFYLYTSLGNSCYHLRENRIESQANQWPIALIKSFNIYFYNNLWDFWLWWRFYRCVMTVVTWSLRKNWRKHWMSFCRNLPENGMYQYR